MDRKSRLLSMFDASGLGLEIGPSYNPLVPKSEGFDVEVLDHASTSELVEKYRNDPTVDIGRIEEVDHVSDGRPISEIIGKRRHFDYVVASHVIEHTPNLVGFLNDCEAVLKEGGSLVLAIPDKRYCFDFYRPYSSLGRVMEAHEQNRTRHSYASIFDQEAYLCEAEGKDGSWSKLRDVEKVLRFDVHRAARIAALHADGRYIDSHGWQFTPFSFRLILEELHALRITRLREADFYAGAADAEFLAVLSTEGKGPGMDRHELLEGIGHDLARPYLPKPEAPAQAIEMPKPEAPARGIGKLEGELRHACEAARRAEAKAEALQAELDAVRSSTSWRVTRPMRALKGLMA